METFNPLHLSRKLAGRKVLFVGDSLMTQQFQSLSRLMCPDEERCAVSTLLDPDLSNSHFISLHDAVFQIEVTFKSPCDPRRSVQ